MYFEGTSGSFSGKEEKKRGGINGYALPNLNVEWRSNEKGSRCVRGGEENPGGREQGWKIHGGGDEG
jgi:hypothetical protein